jgi:uncharacterized membrane protein YccC
MKTRLLSLIKLIRSLYEHHQDALLIAARVGLSASLAYLIATLQHLPETYWPVLSAVIVARGGAKGAGGSASDRLVGTLAGAGVGLAASFLHHFGLPDWLLLFLAMAPLAFISADNTAFRAAPMAAMIVLSAATAGRSGLAGMGVALFRVLDVGMGTLVALFVSYVLLPSNAIRNLRRDAAALMMPLANLLSLGARPEDVEARDKFTRLNARTKREMRELVIAARQIRARKEQRDGPDTLPNQFTTALGRTHGTIIFITRALSGAPLVDDVRDALKPFLRTARARLGGIHHLLSEGTPLDPSTELDAAVALASARIERHATDNPAVHLEAMPFLLETLRDDLDELATLASNLPRPGGRFSWVRNGALGLHAIDRR